MGTEWVKTEPVGDSHSWAVPVETCDNCPCCTKQLCERSAAAKSSCHTESGYRGPDQGFMDTRACPCAPEPGVTVERAELVDDDLRSGWWS